MKVPRSQMEEYETQISAEKDTTKALLDKSMCKVINQALIKQERMRGCTVTETVCTNSKAG